MSSVKDVMVDIVTQQPEDSSYDEILRELAYARMVQRGLADADAGGHCPILKSHKGSSRGRNKVVHGGR